jgi:glutamyl-tRNA synthetase
MRPGYNSAGMIRVRFAPSPTGYLHVGGARTALYNWLFARRHGGTLVLRIEDTDVERSSEDMVRGILDSLRWLGLDWDEGPDVGGSYGPYFQSQRIDRYRAIASDLIARQHAYYCYCTPEELRRKREEAQARGEEQRYDRTCLRRSAEERAALEAAGTPRAVRFLVPEGETRFVDAVRGPIVFDHAHIEDFVLLRSDGHPTYQLSVVADDVDMAITHVLRGEDHISNTPKQVLLYEAMGAAVPQFAHVPLILGPDKKRLSKRHGATAVGEYERQGFLAEALVNFLATLGWSPGGDEELFTKEELIPRFALEDIGGGNAVFNPEKLEWFNAQYLMRLADDVLIERVRPWLERAGLWRSELDGARREWFVRVLTLLRPRAKRLGDFVDAGRPFLTDELDRDPGATSKHLTLAVADHLAALRAALSAADPFDATTLEPIVREVATRSGVKPPVLMQATRVAVTGRTASPGLFETLELVGKDAVVRRLEAAEALARRAA